MNETEEKSVLNVEATFYEEGAVAKKSPSCDFLQRAEYVGKKVSAVISGVGRKTIQGKLRDFLCIKINNHEYQTDLSAKNKNFLIDSFTPVMSSWNGKMVTFTCVPTAVKQKDGTEKQGFELILGN